MTAGVSQRGRRESGLEDRAKSEGGAPNWVKGRLSEQRWEFP